MASYNPVITPFPPYSCVDSPFPLPTGNHQSVLCIYESAVFLFYSLACCMFQVPHIRDIIQYLSSSDLFHFTSCQVPPWYYKWQKFHSFLWLSSIPLCVSIFFMCVCVHCIFFIHSSDKGHLGCYHTLAIISKVARNKGVHVSFQISILGFF